jgi:putative endonuclease
MKNNDFFWVYIIECKNNHFYTGYSTNLVRRFIEHKKGSSKSKYTRNFKIKKLVASWRIFGSKGDAMKVESYIKKLNRKEKEILISKPLTLSNKLKDNPHIKADIFFFKSLLIEKIADKRIKENITISTDPFSNIPPGIVLKKKDIILVIK